MIVIRADYYQSELLENREILHITIGAKRKRKDKELEIFGHFHREFV